MRKRKETKDKSGRKRGEAKPPAAVPVLNDDGLVTAIAQTHDRAQRQAVQAVNLALTLRN